MVAVIWKPPAKNVLFTCNNNKHFCQILPLPHYVIKYENLEMLELKDICVKEKHQSAHVNAPQQYKKTTSTFSVKIFSANMQSQ